MIFQAENIWIPVIDFLNSEDISHTLLDSDVKITIKRLGQPLGDDIEKSKEGNFNSYNSIIKQMLDIMNTRNAI